MKNYSKLLALPLLMMVALLGACSGDDDATSGCTPTIWYQDLDGDGLGNPNVTLSDCNQPTGYVANDNDTDDTVVFIPPTFMPLTIGDYWTYDTETTDPQTSAVTQGRDSLYVASATTIGAVDYMELDATATSTGFMTNFLSQNLLRTDNNKLYAQGTIDFDLSAFGGSAHTIDINDAVLLDQQANNNTQLYTTSGTITDPVTINGQNIVLTIDYTFKTIQKESFATMDVNGVTFNQVLKSNLIINAKVDAQVSIGGFPVTLTVVPLQDINVIENYYAENIGLIQSDNNFNIDLDPTVAAQFGLPTNINGPSNQKIDTYVIN